MRRKRDVPLKEFPHGEVASYTGSPQYYAEMNGDHQTCHPETVSAEPPLQTPPWPPTAAVSDPRRSACHSSIEKHYQTCHRPTLSVKPLSPAVSTHSTHHHNSAGGLLETTDRYTALSFYR